MHRVLGHYDRKYAHEAAGGAAETISFQKYPNNRFQAVCSFLSRYFEGGSILEFGAGSGLVARTMSKNGLGFERYVVSEISEARLAGLRSTIDDPRMEIAAIDAENISAHWRTERFDAVILVALIEHLFDPLRAMKQISGILKPGGFAYIDTANIAKYTRRIKLLFGRFPSTASKNEGLTTYEGNDVDLYDEGHFHYFTYRSLELMLLKYCGFSKCRRLGYFQGRLLGARTDDFLARKWPALFSDIALIAYK